MSNNTEVKLSHFAAVSVFILNFFYELFSFIAEPHNFLLFTNAFILSISAVIITYFGVAIGSNLLPQSETTTKISSNQKNTIIINLIILLICSTYTYFYDEPQWMSQLANSIQVASPILIILTLLLSFKRK